MSGRAAITGYPVNLVVASRRCVVVGAGRIAARKIAALLDAGADVHVIAPEATAEVREWAEAGRLRLDDRKFEPADLDGAWLATTATGDPDVDHAVFAAAEDRHVWVNSADDPENCSFTLMSVVRSGDLVVTIGTGGRSPALASWLKARFEAELGPEYAILLDILVGGPGRAPGVRTFLRRRRLATGARFRHARIDPRRSCRRSQGDAARMSLVVVGLNHRTVPVELLERLAIAPAALPKALESLGRCEHLAEVVLLSTCNRTEVYAHATLFHPAMQDVRDFLSDVSGVDPDEFSDLLYAYHDDAAVAHLFGVAAGLDSMIIGEGEILGQVREAWQAAEQRGSERAAAVAHVPPRDRSGQARPHRDRDRPARGVGVVGGGVVGEQPPRHARRPARARAGRGRDGPGHGARARGRGRARDRRRQPHDVAG